MSLSGFQGKGIAMNSNEVLTLSHATERDVDLLLVEELRCSRSFAEWIAERAGIPKPLLSVRVTHSRRRMFSRREIDILLEMETGSGRHWLLVENKLDTDEQPGQAESYREECSALGKATPGAVARCILVSPASYRQQKPGFAGKFDAVVTYEDVAEHLECRAQAESGELRDRLVHRMELMEQAINKSRRGYERIPLASIRSFNERYVELLMATHPEFIPGPQMLNKEGNPSESVSMIFDHQRTLGALPAGVNVRRLAHEFGRGQDHRSHYVAATFAGWGRHLDRIEATDALVDTPYRLRSAASTSRPNGGLVMYAETPAIINDPGRFDEQCEAILVGLQALAELRMWLRTNTSCLRKWAGLCSS